MAHCSRFCSIQGLLGVLAVLQWDVSHLQLGNPPTLGQVLPLGSLSTGAFERLTWLEVEFHLGTYY